MTINNFEKSRTGIWEFSKTSEIEYLPSDINYW